ncbi:VOC family protein [Aestuariispira ectoiniformans]|uniref:VOC family protein n=1 Tax=Aestuariispira ectoiniformans TaxID=2775080 RepID=UPI00223C3DAB|nr:VOC family protein [Aestuariispira ectoiniformans]
MATKSTKEAWSVSPEEYGRSLNGFGVNLLVRDMEASLAFAQDVLQAETVYWNEDFAVLRRGGASWMLHADHTYEDNPLLGFVQGQEGRGAGVELRLYDLDPDATEARARTRGDHVLSGAQDKPHGLRECYLLDPDGYCWVPSRPL